MNSKEVEKVLEELQEVRPEMLTGEAKRLFEAIMKIADERDYYKNKYEQFVECYKHTRDCNEEFEL